MKGEEVDVVIVGAGIVGLAIAARLAKAGRDVIVLEKNKQPGLETSSHSSEVIHAGMYYPPGSKKARFCIDGNRELYSIALKYGIPHQRMGKYIVAVTTKQIPALRKIYRQGLANGVPGLNMVGREVLQSQEPSVRGAAAIFSSTTGIIDTARLLRFFLAGACEGGVHVLCSHAVVGIDRIGGRYSITVRDPNGAQQNIRTPVVINSAGLGADAIAAMAGIPTPTLEYWKGEYFSIQEARFTVRHLVYPLPDPVTGGLGIHLTLDLQSRMRLGPSAFLLPDRHYDYRVDETHREAFYKAATRYLPRLRREYLQPEGAGIRPRLPRKNGELQDFIIRHEASTGCPGFINLIGIESPGITACPAIARYVETIVRDYLS